MTCGRGEEGGGRENEHKVGRKGGGETLVCSISIKMPSQIGNGEANDQATARKREREEWADQWEESRESARIVDEIYRYMNSSDGI
jgi:hypothetical protein